MRTTYLSLLIVTIFSCEKERCYTIEGKEIINGEYYLLLDNNNSYGDRSNNYSSNNNLYTGVPDPYGTGKVDKETYDSIDKIGSYRKKYGRGNNFDYSLVEIPETRNDNHPGFRTSGICTWSEITGIYNVDSVDMVRLIEKKSINITWEDPGAGNKIYEGTIKFVDREPTKEEWEKTDTKELKRDSKKEKKELFIVLTPGMIVFTCIPIRMLKILKLIKPVI